jgi:hypothetical protein
VIIWLSYLFRLFLLGANVTFVSLDTSIRCKLPARLLVTDLGAQPVKLPLGKTSKYETEYGEKWL